MNLFLKRNRTYIGSKLKTSVSLALLFSLISPLLASVQVGWEANPDPLVVGYRVYLGTSSGDYDESYDTGNVTEFELAELDDSRNYFFVVTAYNIFDLESQPSSEVVIEAFDLEATANVGKLVLIEAESGTLSGNMVVNGSGPSAWVEAESVSQSGIASLEFEISEESDYRIWCRLRAPSSSTDSFFVSINGEAEQVFHVYGAPSPPVSVFQAGWTWQPITVDGVVRSANFSPGLHTISFRVREAGTLLDRLIVSSDPEFVPTDSVAREGSFIKVTESGRTGNVASGGGFSLWARTLSTDEYSFQWYRDGELLVGETKSFLQRPTPSDDDRGNYSLEATRLADGVSLILADFPLSVDLPSLVIRSFQRLSSTQLSFQLGSPASRTFQVQASTNLSGNDWESLGTWNEDSSGMLIVSDPDAGGHARRFYRVLLDE